MGEHQLELAGKEILDEFEAMNTYPVYEGKSMQGRIDPTRRGFFPDGSKVLYAHLGGAPALNGYRYHYKGG